MEVVIYQTYEQMSVAAAAEVAAIVRAKPDAVLGLATGSTPLGLYGELIRLHKEEGLSFSKVTTFNLDEYVGLGGDHEQSYRRFMNDNLFSQIDVPPGNTHVPDGLAKDIPAHCREYEQQIVDAGGIDVQILGIGGDGHIAFNEPSSSLASRTRLKTLARQTIGDNARFFDRLEDVPVYAITMGVGTILEARKLILLANKKGKAAAVAAAIEGPVTSMITASALQLHPHGMAFLDDEAASELKMREYYDWIQARKSGAPKSS
jgi:glucosamine-6-phosphate deaminase